MRPLFLVFVVSIFAGVGFVPQVVPARSSQIAGLDFCSVTHSLLQAAYPELSRSGVEYNIASDQWRAFDGPALPLLSMVMTLAQRSPGHGVPTKLLAATATFAPSGILSDLDVVGTYLNDAKRMELHRLAIQESDSSPEKVSARLTTAGARFVANRADAMQVEASRVMMRIARVLGPIELDRVRLIDDGTAWRAEVTVSASGVLLRYAVLFEPFDGRFAGMVGVR